MINYNNKIKKKKKNDYKNFHIYLSNMCKKYFCDGIFQKKVDKICKN